MPTGPVAFDEKRRVLPFRQFRRLGQRGGHGLADDLVAEARRQGIHRLDALEASDLLGRADGVRMTHLEPSVELLQPAGDDAHLALGQNALEIVRPGMEEDQLDLARIVMAGDAVGHSPVARRLVSTHADRERCDAPRFRFAKLGRVATVDYAARQVPTEVDHMGPGEALDQLGVARTDAGQRGHGREKRKENLRSQCALSPSACAADPSRGWSPGTA